MAENLSIGIPTFNREKQLEHQLKCILKQDLSSLKEIIIIDNDSCYDIERLIKSFGCPKIRLDRNPFNIKMATNMEMPFLYCKTEWLWLLSDDDEVLPNSINTIINEINNCSTDTGMIKLAIDRPKSIQNECYAKSLVEYIDYYFEEKPIRRGDLVFISTNVYNVKRLKNYLGAAFEFSYTYIGFLMPVILGLAAENISVKFSSKPVVKFIPPREGWYSFGTVGKGLSTVSHIPLNISKKYRKKFLNITMSIPYITLMKGILAHEKNANIDDLRIIYNNIYRYYIPWKGKFFVNLFFISMSSNTTQKLTLRLYEFLKRIK
jgi:glycosyltransferase involved in cell wall biosynthesis